MKSKSTSFPWLFFLSLVVAGPGYADDETGGSEEIVSVSLQLLATIVSEAAADTDVFSIVVSSRVPLEEAKTVAVRLEYGGTATDGIDYQPLPYMVWTTIDSGETLGESIISVKPIDDSDDEGDETIIISLIVDSGYQLIDRQSISCTIADNDEIVAPTIITHPRDTTLSVGDQAVFVVECSGTPPFTRQWRKNGTVLGSNMEAEYTTRTLSMADDGAVYNCVVSNSAGSATTNDAVVHVTQRPDPVSIVQGPRSVTLAEGDTAVFTVQAAGAEPLQYTWFRDGVVIDNEDGESLALGPVSLEDNGARISCLISNSVNEVETRSATLSVKRPTSHMIVVTGELFDSQRAPVGYAGGRMVDMVIRLYSSVEGGEALYTESFLEEGAAGGIEVRDGRFVVRLGEGETSQNLMEVVRSHPNLYVEFSVTRPGGNPETLAPRTPLTSSPYALSAASEVMRGKVDPADAGLEAPIGTHYINTDTETTFIRTYNGWAALHGE